MGVPGTALAIVLFACPAWAQDGSAFGELRRISGRTFDIPDAGRYVEAASKPLPVDFGACRVSEMIRTPVGRWTVAELRAAAKTVFGEASPNPDEQCGVALTIFNRAAEDGDSLREVVTEPGQFEGYSGVDVRPDCEKLVGSVRAVLHLAAGGSCRFGKPKWKFFCAYDALRKSKRPKAARIGETAFFTDDPC
ncbi:MAG: hypothetical protein HY553_12200 [Elusimicrobia bacterium]|nr:hypothetical protein [Elusimicrobiota bacterium]